MLFSRSDLKRLLIPLLLEQLLAVTIGAADTVMVSSCGEAAVSAISLVDSINILLIQLFSALATGGAVVASQYLGKKEPDNAGVASKQLIYTVTLVSVAIMGVCLAFRKPMLSAIFGTIEPEVMENAVVYFLFTALSYPFLGLYNAQAALLRSMGDSRASLDTSLVMNLVNIGGNALLIFGFGMGAAGAAIATLFSRIIGTLMIGRMMRRPGNSIKVPSLLRFTWRGDMVKRILAVGVPTGLENSLFQLGKLILLRLVATFGTVSIAANAISNTISTIEVLPGSAISLAMVTVVGRCAGAREYGQARQYTKKLMLLAYACMSVLNICIILLADPIVGFFHLSPETAGLAKKLFTLHAWGSVFLWPLSFVLPNALRAANDARFTMIVSVFSMMTFRIVFGYLLADTFHMGVYGVWIAMQIDWVFRIVMFIIRFHGHKWEARQLV